MLLCRPHVNTAETPGIIRLVRLARGVLLAVPMHLSAPALTAFRCCSLSLGVLSHLLLMDAPCHSAPADALLVAELATVEATKERSLVERNIFAVMSFQVEHSRLMPYKDNAHRSSRKNMS